MTNRSSIFLQRRSRPMQSFYHSLTFLRFMGGGPRTFPGGLNKWQWKRLHEKKAREKEKRLLEHEKQLYQARVRSQIRANLSASQNLASNSDQTGYRPMSPQEHIRTLADRFMKEGAEDLWNEDDGPVKTPPPMPKRRTIGEPIDLQKVFIRQNSDFSNNNINESGNSKCSSDFVPGARNFSSGSAGLVGLGFSLKGYCGDVVLKNSNNWFIHRRSHSSIGYSMGMDLGLRCGSGTGPSMYSSNSVKFRWYSVDTRGDNMSKRFTSARNLDNQVDHARPKNSGKARFPRHQMHRSQLDSSDDDSDYDDEEGEEEMNKGNVNRMASTAALGRYDVKTKKRVPLKSLEDEDDLSRHVEIIRKDVNKRSLEGSGREKMDQDQETIYSSKRFDEYDISPLTLQALNAAGYIQMTRVQEATLSVCLQGKLSFPMKVLPPRLFYYL